MGHARQLRWVAAALLLTVLAAAVAAAAQANGPAAPAQSAQAVAPVQAQAPPVVKGAVTAHKPRGERAPMPATFREVAARGYFRLFWDGQGAQLAVEDTRSGERWFSTPQDMAAQKGISDLWKSTMQSLFLITYTDQRLQQPQNTSMMAELAPGKGSMQQSVSGGTIRLDFSLTGLSLAFRMEISLTERGLLVRVPAESVRETGKSRLIRMDLLPFLGATRSVTDGYMLLPDGSGALVRFKDEPSQMDQLYSEPIYGGDFAKQGESASRQKVRVPVFGLALSPGDKQDGAALLGIVTEGDSAAGINAATSGHVVPYNRVWPTFYYRQQYTAVLSRGNRPILYEKELIRGDRAVLYTFLTGEGTTYDAMAGAYREFLMQEQKVPRVTRGEGPVASLRLTGGDLETGAFFRPFAAATTFGEAEQIVRTLQQQGAGRINLVYGLWVADGPRTRPPYRWEPAPELGGADGLRRLGALLKSNGIPFYLAHNYAYAWGSGRGFNPRTDAARGPSKQPFSGEFDSRTAKVYMINQKTALERFLEPDLQRYAGYEASGLLLGASDLLYSDYSGDHISDREEAKRLLAEQFRKTREGMGRVAAEGFLPYMLGTADFVQALPVTGSSLYLTDEEIPFLQIALHGLVRYGSDFGNLRDRPKADFLKVLETGAVPAYHLTAKPSEVLKRTESGVYLYSSDQADWLPAFLDEYRRMEQDFAHLDGLFITGHRQAAPGVYETRYEDGTRVLVNYGDRPVSVDGLTVAGLGYAVQKGGAGR